MSFTRVTETAKRPRVVVPIPPIVKKSSKSRSFHFRYLELCRAKNITPVPNIRSNPNVNNILELVCDKLGVSEWLLIIDALRYDLVLQTLVLRMRRTNGNNVVVPIDSENRARLFRQKPVVYTRFILSNLVEATANCLKLNKNLTVFKLEGLPLQDGYIDAIAESLAANDCLKEISFQRSYIGDKGCETLCGTVKYMNHVETFNISDCNISAKGAEHVAEMIKMQKISRFSEGWEKSLRYRSIDTNSISGLRNIILSNNPNIRDEGVRLIAEVLKEDAWVKTMDMENCGLTDIGANIILECLGLNNALTEFNLRHNDSISKFLQRQIRDQMGKEDDEKVNEPQYDLSCVSGLKSLPKNQKFTISQLLTHTKTLEEQLSFERTLRKKAEKLNEKLNQQLLAQEQKLASIPPLPTQEMTVPKGYVAVKNDSPPNIHYSQQQFSQLVNSEVSSSETTPRSDNTTLRKEQQKSAPIEMQPEVVDDEAEEYSRMPDHADQQQQQQQRQILHVRRVRSEMKYVEENVKDKAKKRESKSDHEFANERDFKLNPKVQFEMDIGDGAAVSQHYEEGNMNSNRRYEQEEYIGDGVCKEKDSRKHSAKSKSKSKHYNEMNNSQMAQYLVELEHKIYNKCVKKRVKNKNQLNENHVNNYMNDNVDSYIGDVAIDSPEHDSDSGGKSERSQGSKKYSRAPMKVFVRRQHYDDEPIDAMQHYDDEEEETNGQLISPRSAFLEMQRKICEGN